MKGQVVVVVLFLCILDIGSASSNLNNTESTGIINSSGPIGNNVGNIGAEPRSNIIYGNGRTKQPGHFYSTNESFYYTGGIGIIKHIGPSGKDNGIIGGGAHSHAVYGNIAISGGRPAATSVMVNPETKCCCQDSS